MPNARFGRWVYNSSMAGKPLRALAGSRRTWWLLVLVLTTAAIAERGLRSVVSGARSPTGGARWIWAASTEPSPDETPSSGNVFFAFRDFELAGYPGRGRLSCRGDEEAFVYLNGALVDVSRFRDGEALSTYEVGYLLQPGVNRIAVELRSIRGGGGFLLDLEVEGRSPIRIGSDDQWQVARAYLDDLLVPGTAIEGAERAIAGAAPPVGRWGFLERAGASLPFIDRISPSEGRHAHWALSDRTAGAWRGLAPPNVSSPPLGSLVTFDFGREVVGYANVVFGRKEGARGLVFAGAEPPDSEADRPVAYLLNSPGRKSWSDTRPRRFRYLTVAATAEMVGARVLAVVPELARSALAAAAPAEGVFGLEPLNLRTPIENEIRSELERLAGIAAGEDV